MRQEELIRELSRKIGLSIKDTRIIVKALVDLVVNKLKAEEEVALSKFGKFYVKKRALKKGRDFKHNKPIIIEERKVVLFKPSKNIINKIK